MCIDYNSVRVDRKWSECLNPFAIACRTGVDQGMRDWKGVHIINDSYYHRETGAVKT